MKRHFLFIVDNEVGFDFYFEDQGDGSARFQKNAAMAACLSSNPQIVEIPAAESDADYVDYFGWGYKDGKLTKPTE